MKYGGENGDLTWEEYNLVTCYRALEPAQQEGILWLAENFPLLDRLLDGGRLTREEWEAARRSLEERGDWRMAGLLNYKWEVGTG